MARMDSTRWLAASSAAVAVTALALSIVAWNDSRRVVGTCDTPLRPTLPAGATEIDGLRGDIAGHEQRIDDLERGAIDASAFGALQQRVAALERQLSTLSLDPELRELRRVISQDLARRQVAVNADDPKSITAQAIPLRRLVLDPGEDPVVRLRAVQALRIAGLTDADVLLTAADMALVSGDPWFREQMWYSLEGAGEARLVTPMINAYNQEPAPGVRETLLSALREYHREPGVMEVLRRAAAQDRSSAVRELASNMVYDLENG